MNEFNKVLSKLDAQETDTHTASEATKKRMATLDRRYNGEEETAEVERLTKTAENLLQVEVNLNSGSLATLKNALITPENQGGFKDFLRNIAHKNQKNRATALRQMESILGLKTNSLSLSMSDKHSEQLIRTEILDHIMKQLLGGSAIPPFAPNYEYGSDTALDTQLDELSNQVIAMLEGFKESNSQEAIDPQTAAYNALYKSSDQRYFDDKTLKSGNKLKGGVITGFAERMAKGRRVDYKTLHAEALNGEPSIDLNTKDVMILTGNGMLPFDARTRSQFQFQYLVYLPELEGYAGLMANGCGDVGREGNFVFINTEEITTKKEVPVKVKEEVKEETITTPTEVIIIPTEEELKKEKIMQEEKEKGWINMGSNKKITMTPKELEELKEKWRKESENYKPLIPTNETSLESKRTLEQGYQNSIIVTLKDLGLDNTSENKEIVEEFYLEAHDIVAKALETPGYAENLKKAESTFKTNRREITKDFVEKAIERLAQDKELGQKISEQSITQEEAISEILQKEIVKKDLDHIIKERNNRYKPSGTIKDRYANGGGKVNVGIDQKKTIAYLIHSLFACKKAAKNG